MPRRPVAPAAADHYATLGVAPAASREEVRAAYRRRSRAIHPDRNHSPTAHQEMAALNAAWAVLSHPARRAEYDRTRPPSEPASMERPTSQAPEAPREYTTPPITGTGSLQPDRLPDWYGFLGLRPFADPAHVIDAIARVGAEVRAAHYEPATGDRLLRQLREAADTLTNPRHRAVYDDAISGTRPPPGSYPHLHADWYSYLGVRPTGSFERIAERVTELSGRLRKGTPEYRAVEEAWKTLNDPSRRAAYDRQREAAGP